MSIFSPKLVTVGVGSLGLTFLSYMCAGIANADTGAPPPPPGTNIYVGGNMDCTSQGMVGVKQAQGQYDYRANNIAVSYSTCDGSFAPFMGSTPTNVAIDQGVAATQQAWNDNCQGQVPGRCTLDGFSLGAPIVSIVGTNVGADQPGSNTHVITEGNAWADPGVLGDTPNFAGGVVRAAAPFVGAPQSVPQVPGSENRFNINDFWGNAGDQNPGDQIAQLATINGVNGGPPQHEIPAGAPNSTFVSDDGVTQEVFNTGGAFPGVVNPADVPDPNLPGPDAP